MDIIADRKTKIAHYICDKSIIYNDFYTDITVDIEPEKLALELSGSSRNIELARGGHFKFQTGIETHAIETLYLRVSDAQKRFASFPLHTVSEQLEPEVIATSIYSTNTIEGGALDYEQTQIALALSPDEVKEVEEQRVSNLKEAYALASAAGTDEDWALDVAWIKRVHAAVTHELPHEHDRPGVVRDNPKDLVTRVGSENHGGVYKPPQYGGDIEQLLQALISWQQDLKAAGVPALIRAPLAHLYYELIHPFYDCNGRVGRVIEASILINDGFSYAPFSMADHYRRNIDKYFALFNHSRKAAARGDAGCHNAFVAFFLEEMLGALNKLHDRCNMITRVLMYEYKVKQLHETKKLNTRQYTILQQIAHSATPIRSKELSNIPWYAELYRQLHPKTAKRDFDQLFAEKLLEEHEGLLRPSI